MKKSIDSGEPSRKPQKPAQQPQRDPCSHKQKKPCSPSCAIPTCNRKNTNYHPPLQSKALMLSMVSTENRLIGNRRLAIDESLDLGRSIQDRAIGLVQKEVLVDLYRKKAEDAKKKEQDLKKKTTQILQQTERERDLIIKPPRR